MDRRTKQELMGRLERDALRICARFRLKYLVLESERANVKRRYGVCFSDGTIRIRLRHVTSGKPLKYSSLVNTLCHELAHLRHFNHGQHFQTLYGEILEWARRERIYQPGSAKKIADTQRVDLARSSTRLASRPASDSPPRQAKPKRPIVGARKPLLVDQLELFG